MRKQLLRMFSLMFIALLAFSSVTCLADTANLKTTRQFMEYCDSRSIVYSFAGLSSDGNSERVNVSFKLSNFDTLQCAIFFKDDCEQVSLRIWNIISASAGKNDILSALNKLNSNYKFGKFVLDESNATVQVEMDMCIDGDHCGRCVYDAMEVLFFLVDSDDVAKTIHSLE